jgi:hypothetical protein
MTAASQTRTAPTAMNNDSARATGVVAPEASPRRLLIPIDATERSRWAVRYAHARHRAGDRMNAVLIHVAEPVTNWQVLRFRTHDEIAHFQAERGRFLLEDAAQSFREEGIPCRTVYREGETAFHVLDVAEQLDCNEIVLPEPPPRLLTLLTHDLVRNVLRNQRDIPVVTVNQYGTPNGIHVDR